MNKEIKQILRNQLDIMRWIGTDPDGYFKCRIEETDELLNPSEEPTIKERTKDALSEDAKRGK